MARPQSQNGTFSGRTTKKPDPNPDICRILSEALLNIDPDDLPGLTRRALRAVDPGLITIVIASDNDDAWPIHADGQFVCVTRKQDATCNGTGLRETEPAQFGFRVGDGFCIGVRPVLPRCGGCQKGRCSGHRPGC